MKDEEERERRSEEREKKKEKSRVFSKERCMIRLMAAFPSDIIRS